MLLGGGLCDELITRPEESYRLWCVVVCDLETSRMGAPYIYIYIYGISSLGVNIRKLKRVGSLTVSPPLSAQLHKKIIKTFCHLQYAKMS